MRTQKDFYQPLVINPEDQKENYKCYENTSVNFIANFQYLVVCMVYSISKPFRQPLYSNLWLTLSITVLVSVNTFLVISDEEFVVNLMDFESNVSMNFRLTCLVVVVINSIVSYLFERVIVWRISIWSKKRQDRKILLEQQR